MPNPFEILYGAAMILWLGLQAIVALVIILVAIAIAYLILASFVMFIVWLAGWVWGAASYKR